jgi:3-hydroxyisobutyrate dehydrogenase-like beta-hydroxyacid dehydrogenase
MAAGQSATTIALLNPGDMGSGVGAALAARGHRVLCALEGRSPASHERARMAKLEDAGSLEQAVRQAAVVLSVCPPHAALDVAGRVAGCGFTGLYVDANAISPATAHQVAARVGGVGAAFVDGGIFGAPPTPAKPGKLYLSGPRAREAAQLFEGSFMSASVLDDRVGAASALKACYAAWTKGTWLLLASIYATAQEEGVEAALREEWSRSQPDVLRQVGAPSANPAKAWRWLAEMQEIAQAFESAGQPGGFAQAAAEICRRLESYKDDGSKPSIEKVVGAVRRQP